jgi:DNA-binding GntR family transcriptional regulator
MTPPAVLLSPPKRQSLGQTVADTLREAIYGGRFRPGDRIAQATVAQELSVSQTTIRDAFTTLEREGLVVRGAHQGAVVTKLSRADVDEIVSLRTTLEAMAVRRLIQQATAEQVAQLEENIQTMQATATAGQVADLDLQFHELLVRFANHKRLYACWQTLKTQIKLLMVGHNLRERRARQQTVENHRQLMRWIKARDEARAVDHVQRHSEVYRLQPLEESASGAKA